MFYFLSMTTLKKEVKKGLLNKAYSEDEAREIYKEYLKLKQDRMVGFKQAGKMIISTFILLTILSLFNLKRWEYGLCYCLYYWYLWLVY